MHIKEKTFYFLIVSIRLTVSQSMSYVGFPCINTLILHFIDDEINAWSRNALLENLLDRKEFIEIPR